MGSESLKRLRLLWLLPLAVVRDPRPTIVLWSPVRFPFKCPHSSKTKFTGKCAAPQRATQRKTHTSEGVGFFMPNCAAFLAQLQPGSAEVSTLELDDRCEFLVVASDGIWEFLTNQAVVDAAAQFLDPAEACDHLVKRAYHTWLDNEVRTDDITCIVVHVFPEAGDGGRGRKRSTGARVGGKRSENNK